MAHPAPADLYPTPYERGNQNQTTQWTECIAFYERLATDFPRVLHFLTIDVADNGLPLHAGVVSCDGVFDRAQIKADDCGDAQMDDGMQIEPDWDLAVQPAPDFEADQRINWCPGKTVTQTRFLNSAFWRWIGQARPCCGFCAGVYVG